MDPRGRRETTRSRVVQRAAVRLHRRIYTLSGGRVLGRIGANHIAVLTTTGRTSGKPRSAVLFAYRDGDDYLVVASNGGTARTPAWMRNLEVDPDATLRVGRREWPVRAHVLDDVEKAVWWPKVVASYGSYASYQKITDRVIPMIRLQPVETAS